MVGVFIGSFYEFQLFRIFKICSCIPTSAQGVDHEESLTQFQGVETVEILN